MMIIPVQRLTVFGAALALVVFCAFCPATVGQTLEPPAIDPSLPEGTQVVLRAVRDANPQTSIELVRALNTMLDLDEYQHAKYYLARVKALNLDDPQRFEVYEVFGSDVFLKLHSIDEVQPEGREFAKQVLNAAHALATSPERLRSHVERLSDQDISARAATIRTLRKLGPEATAEMLATFADPDRQSEFPYVRQALKVMGDDAVPPLLGAARASNLQVQAEAVRALGHYRSSEATDAMMRTYLSPKLPEALRRVALDSLMRTHGTPADPKVVEHRFYERANEFLMGKRLLPQGLSGEVTVWQWDATAKRVRPLKLPTSSAQRLAASQMASDLYEISPHSPQNRALYLLTYLESTKRISGSSSEVAVETIRQHFEGLEVSEVEQALSDAIRLNLYPAATACCEILGQIGAAELVVSTTDKPRLLVEAIQTGDRHVQAAALEAIQKLDPRQAYVGSSFVFSLAVFMATSEGRGAGLVGDNRSDVAQTYAALLQAARLSGKSASTGQDIFQQAIENPDVEFVVLTDSLHRPDYLELIQQLRKDMRTKRLPIALLTRDTDSTTRVQRLTSSDSLFLTLPMTLEPEHVALQVQRIQALIDPWPVSALDRQRHASLAIEWLAKIASDRANYRFYDLGSRHTELARILYVPGHTESGGRILKQLGTPSAQRELLNFIGQSNFPLEARQAAAQAFVEAIKAGGALLTREEILRQYDRYNASAHEPVEIQQLLGSVLDALEAQAGPRKDR